MFKICDHKLGLNGSNVETVKYFKDDINVLRYHLGIYSVSTISKIEQAHVISEIVSIV